MSSQHVQWLRDVDSVIMATAWPDGMPVYNQTTKRWHVGDGVTLGGTPMAKLTEVVALTSTSFASFVNSLPTSPSASGTTWNNGGIPTVVP